MAKLTKEEKIEIYKRRIKGETLSNLSNKFKINISNIKYLIALIDKHGVSILRNSKNMIYSKEFKLECINRVLSNKESINFASLDVGLTTPSLLLSWVKKYIENGYNIIEKKKGRKPKSMVRKIKNNKEMTIEEKYKELEKENLYLKAENEYLKKLKALIQERELKEKKK